MAALELKSTGEHLPVFIVTNEVSLIEVYRSSAPCSLRARIRRKNVEESVSVCIASADDVRAAFGGEDNVYVVPCGTHE